MTARGWTIRLRALPLRTKVTITVVGGALALLGASTHVSFRYWKTEALAVAEHQARLAAASLRAPVEAALVAGEPAQARRSLRQLVESGALERARIYAPDGRILLSSHRFEEGQRERAVWVPRRDALPVEGLVRHDAEAQTVEAFLPLSVPGAVFLQVTFPLGPLRAAMDRGLRVGLVLIVASVLGMAALLFSMLEREVMTPVRRVSGLVGGADAARRPHADELHELAVSIEELLARERAAEALAEERRQQIEAQAGLAEVGEMAAEMAHEFKRPLATIQTALELMSQEYALDARGERLLGSVRAQLDKLSETMRDLFALARPVEVERAPVALPAVLDAALLQLGSHPAARGLEIRRDYQAAPAVCGDARRLEQAVLNLLLNAAEAMPTGGRLWVRLMPEPGRVVVEVADTGVGIPPEALDEVLRPFYSTKPMGTGLGLALVARIVAAHEGTLRIASEPGRGTTVCIELPAASAAATPPPPEARWLTLAS